MVTMWGSDPGTALGCRTLLTEDLNDGQDYDGVRIENPLRRGE